MKKLTLIILLFGWFLGQAQFTLTNNETGQQINDGDIIIINTNNFTTHVIATNTDSQNIYLAIDVLNITNTNGTEMEFCFGIAGLGSCHFSMNIGDHYSSGGSIAPGESTQNTDIDFTHHDGTAYDSNEDPLNFPNYPKDYVVKIYASYSNDGGQIGNAITFTYRYDPNASSINSPEKDMVNYFVSGKTLNVFTKENLSLKIYNLTGKLLYQNKLPEGNKKIYLNNFSTGIYIIEFSNDKTKILRKFILK